jgi:predicted O-linked N-acetylglucosamine transferase (SPINDLY family)
VFAQRVPRVEDHLARYRQADLFLDTHPYNAHTTAADALLAGLPVLTYSGRAFPSRVAGSLLHAAGLPELVTHDPADYERLAIALAQDPARLAALKAKLAAQRAGCALLDADGYTRNLEAIYTAMWRDAQLGGAHDALSRAD